MFTKNLCVIVLMIMVCAIFCHPATGQPLKTEWVNDGAGNLVLTKPSDVLGRFFDVGSISVSQTLNVTLSRVPNGNQYARLHIGSSVFTLTKSGTQTSYSFTPSQFPGVGSTRNAQVKLVGVVPLTLKKGVQRVFHSDPAVVAKIRISNVTPQDGDTAQVSFRLLSGLPSWQQSGWVDLGGFTSINALTANFGGPQEEAISSTTTTKTLDLPCGPTTNVFIALETGPFSIHRKFWPFATTFCP